MLRARTTRGTSRENTPKLTHRLYEDALAKEKRLVRLTRNGKPPADARYASFDSRIEITTISFRTTVAKTKGNAVSPYPGTTPPKRMVTRRVLAKLRALLEIADAFSEFKVMTPPYNRVSGETMTVVVFH